jgi:hypothetical protein
LGFATRALYDGIAEAEGGTVGLPPAHIDIEPADIIELGITDDLADVVQVKAIKRLTNDAMEIEYTTFLQDVEIERVGYAGSMPEIIVAAGIIETSASQTTQLPTQFALIQLGDIITAQALSQTSTLPTQTATGEVLEAGEGESTQTTLLPTQTATGTVETGGPVGVWAWFKPETLGSGGSSISQWDDSSGNGRHAVQATGAHQPVVAAGELAGFSAVSAVDDTDGLQLPSMAAFTAGSAFLVLKASNDTATHGFPIQASPASGGGEGHYPYDSTQVYTNFGSTSRPMVFDPTAYNIDTYHILSLHSATNDKRIYIGNVLVYSNATNTVAFETQPSIMGWFGVRTWGWIGKICEVTIFQNTAMTTGERNAEYDRLVEKYGLSPTWNPSDKGAGVNLSGGNLTATRNATGSTTQYHSVRATLGKTTGKWQWRIIVGQAHALWNGSWAIGLANASHNVGSDYLGSSNNSIGYHAGGLVWRGGSNLGAIGAGVLSGGDVVDVLWDADNDTISFNKNGGAFCSPIDVSALTGTLYPAWYAIFETDYVTVDFILSGVTLESGFSRLK